MLLSVFAFVQLPLPVGILHQVVFSILIGFFRSIQAPLSSLLQQIAHAVLCFLDIMKMTSAFGMKAAFVAVLLLLALSSVPAEGAPSWAPKGWGYAHATFYGSHDGQGTEGGACAYVNTLSRGYGTRTAALSTALFREGAACGACFQLRCVKIKETPTQKNWCWNYARSMTITATNFCPQNSQGGWCNFPQQHFDLSMPAFSNLAKIEGGVIPVFYRRVRCVKHGGIRFTISGNPWFLMILIHNVGGAGDVKSVKIHSPSTGWIPMYRNWGALWTVPRKLTGSLSFMITGGDRRVLVASNAVGARWGFGQTWEAKSNFR